MSKFNLYDQNTWETSINDMATKIRNKAIGSIGQKISLVRELQGKIKNLINGDQGEDTDFAIAEHLRLNNPAAYQQMKIEIELPHDEVKRILDLTSDILNAWKDTEGRGGIWKSLIPKLQELEPFFESSCWDRLAGERKVNELVSVKVSGNEAWQCYIGIAKNLSGALKTIAQYEDDDPRSCDYDDD